MAGARATLESVAYHHFHADVAIDAVHEDIAERFISILPLMHKGLGGHTIHQDSGWARPLHPREIARDKSLKMISHHRREFLSGDPGHRLWKYRVPPIIDSAVLSIRTENSREAHQIYNYYLPEGRVFARYDSEANRHESLVR